MCVNGESYGAATQKHNLLTNQKTVCIPNMVSSVISQMYTPGSSYYMDMLCTA